jgi:hypothetical protein
VTTPDERKARRVMQVSVEVVPELVSLMGLAANPAIDKAVVLDAAAKVKGPLRLPSDGATAKQMRSLQIELWVRVAIAAGAHPAPAPIRKWLLANNVSPAELPVERMFPKMLRKLGYPPA